MIIGNMTIYMYLKNQVHNLVGWSIMFKKRAKLTKEVYDLKRRVEEAETRLLSLRVQYILLKTDRDRLKELIGEENREGRDQERQG